MLVSLKLVLVVLVFVPTDAFIVVHNAPRKVTKIISVSNGGRFGTWQAPHFCADGSYAVGFDMKVEPPQGGLADDSGLNGIRLRCETLDGARYGGDVMSRDGDFGTWVGLTRCDNQQELHFLTSFSLQVEDPQGSLTDDTGANWVKFHCRDFPGLTQQYEITKTPGHGPYGKYGDWSDSCDSNSSICGLATRIELDNTDDTGLNDVKFYCCSE